MHIVPFLFRGRGWLPVLLALLLHLLPGPASALSLRFEVMRVAQGLPQESVIAMTEDRYGFVWLATQTGIARYDGYRTIIFKNDPENPHSLGDSWAQALHDDARGNLWVGTRKGLDRYERVSNRFVHVDLGKTANGTPYGAITAIADDGGGGLWLGSDQGLLHLDGAGAVRPVELTARTALPALPQVFSLARDAAGDLWIGTQIGVLRLKKSGGNVEHFATENNDSKSRRNIARKLLATDGELWVGTLAGLQRWAVGPAGVQPQPLPEAIDRDVGITSLHLDRRGVLWIGTSARGLLRYALNDGKVQAFVNDKTDPFSVSDNYVTTLYEDRSGTLWVGTWSGGVNRVDPESGGFERFTTSVNSRVRLGDNKVYGISGDGKGHLWLTTREAGVNRVRLESGQVDEYRHRKGDPSSLPTDRTLNSALDRRGRLWVVSDEGLAVLDPGTGKSRRFALPVGSSLGFSLMCAYAPPGRDEIWICSRSGTYRIDAVTEEVTLYRHDPARPDSIASDFSTAIFEDGPQSMWIATFGGGLDRLDIASGKFSHHRKTEAPDSISSNRVQTLFRDSIGRLWVGTSSGLNRVSRDAQGRVSFRAYTTRNGLGADSIGGVEEDGTGQLWISTTAGLSRFDPQKETFHNYTAQDGVTDGSFFIGSVHRDADGVLYFGGVGGVTVVRPERLHANKVAPAVMLTDFSIFNRSISEARPAGFSLDGGLETATRAVLPAGLSVFTIEFSALHFADPASNRYAYKLDGFDADWNLTGADRRFATYTNLDPGRYRFLVKAANKDGLWSETPRALEIVIEPPFWKTWWFRLLALFLAASLATIIYRWRIHALKTQAELLEFRIAERTAQLAEALQNLELTSVTDPLTGLNNRRFITQQLDRDAALAIRQVEQAGTEGVEAPAESDLLFFVIDLDHFKHINDHYGHAAGDAVLEQVKPRLKVIFRETDYLVRWGGEEILVVARNAARVAAPDLAERIRQAFSGQAFHLPNGGAVEVTCSIGGASLPFLTQQPRRLNWQEVVELADMALYAAKKSGRNGWVILQAGSRFPAGELPPVPDWPRHELLQTGALVFETNLAVDVVSAQLAA